jgi:outer membrane protein OmpA-like peptidoglycan-associated protein
MFIMKTLKKISIIILSVLILSGCASWNKTQKGAVIGTAAGGVAGAVIGRAAGNTAVGAVVGAAVGGTTGAIIGRKMDKQAEEIAAAVPDAKVERVGEGIVVEFSSNILFGFDQSALSQEAKENLDKLVVILNSYPDTDIELQGHTDDRGSEAYNQGLSERRSQSVANYLLGKSISTERVISTGFGELAPKYDNSTAEGRAQNRRVEFVITANEKMKTDAAKEAGE